MSTVRAPRWPRPGLLAAGAPLVGMTLLGAPAGLVWSLLAPRAELVLTEDGAAYANVEPSAVIAADGWFAVVCACAGLLCGIIVHLLAGRRHSVVTLLSLTAGGLAGALMAWYVGRTVDIVEYQRQVSTQDTGAHVEGFLHVHATGVLVAWPLFAVLTFMLAQIAERVVRGHQDASDAGTELGTDAGTESGPAACSSIPGSHPSEWGDPGPAGTESGTRLWTDAGTDSGR